MILSMGVTAFADEPTGSITVTNATKDQTYTVYKIFDASIKLAADGTAEAVAYSITQDNQFFSVLFGEDGKTENAYFVYEPSTGAVAKRAAAVDSELISYLSKLVSAGSYIPAADPITATNSNVEFDNLPYGYYMIMSTLGAAVTINSNTPDVEVIDKNQSPAPDFTKQIQTGVDESGDPVWGETNSASIGDMVTYKISLTTTNYDGDKLIDFYSIHDDKGDGIWIDFNSIKITVDGAELPRGYYLNHGGMKNTMEYLGNWGDTAKDRDNAQWYLVHLGADEFRISIPWLENHELVNVSNETGVVSHKLVFAEDSESKFNSPAQLVVTYNAIIESNADIGLFNNNLFNRAYASWTSANETGTSSPVTVRTNVYGLGVLKDDGSTGQNLAGAEFRVYSDEACTKPVYVIPTDIQGVYIVDSKNTAAEGVSGEELVTSRVEYAAGLEAYLGENSQDNLVVSQINGKLIVLGLEAGTYYLKETKAPAGYNSLSSPVALTAGEGTKGFNIFADSNGVVANIQQDDGVHSEIIYQLTSTVVHNSKGVELPSTGGEGTMMLITIGTMVAMAFAVLLITHKKMSIYED